MGNRTIDFEDISVDAGAKDAPCNCGSFSGSAEIEDGYVDAITITPNCQGQEPRVLPIDHWLFDPLAQALHVVFADEISETVPPVEPDWREHSTYWGRP